MSSATNPSSSSPPFPEQESEPHTAAANVPSPSPEALSLPPESNMDAASTTLSSPPQPDTTTSTILSEPPNKTLSPPVTPELLTETVATLSVSSTPAPPPPPPPNYSTFPSQPPASYYAAPAPPQNSYQVGAGPSPYGYRRNDPIPYGYSSTPLATLLPSLFPPGTDPNIVQCFQLADRDGDGFIDDKELQTALSSGTQIFSLRTIHLLMYHFTNSNAKKIGPKVFTTLFHSFQNWRMMFERFDVDRSGKMDSSELREALMSLGFSLSPFMLDMLVAKLDKTGGRIKAIEYDKFIECCLAIKGLGDKFKENDPNRTGSATFTFDSFMMAFLPLV